MTIRDCDGRVSRTSLVTRLRPLSPVLYMSIIASEDLNLSSLSLNSNASTEDDWDRSESDIHVGVASSTRTPRNSVLFPGRGEDERTPSKMGAQAGKRTLSELLKVYAEKGTDVEFSQEEASRVADLLGQWINSGSSPYEGDDDFFRSRDDSTIAKRTPSSVSSSKDENATGRPRGLSESMLSSRPTSHAANATKS